MKAFRAVFASYDLDPTSHEYEYSEDWEASVKLREPNCWVVGFTDGKAVIQLDDEPSLRFAYIYELYRVAEGLSNV